MLLKQLAGGIFLTFPYTYFWVWYLRYFFPLRCLSDKKIFFFVKTLSWLISVLRGGDGEMLTPESWPMCEEINPSRARKLNDLNEHKNQTMPQTREALRAVYGLINHTFALEVEHKGNAHLRHTHPYHTSITCRTLVLFIHLLVCSFVLP